ncbi:MAG: hypothetical protein P0Y55_02505 [Candidatus Cohnella colombiensis]|uniref:Uncharacterized protein n=1 Tax=Candidatus Cohnella colombiensis TaxID=3121368 RepID=A0AA95EXY1_9BACL|nr:MAG: hypothetical protein P0Y55_02505 [Cohnella sp.]
MVFSITFSSGATNATAFTFKDPYFETAVQNGVASSRNWFSLALVVNA